MGHKKQDTTKPQGAKTGHHHTRGCKNRTPLHRGAQKTGHHCTTGCKKRDTTVPQGAKKWDIITPQGTKTEHRATVLRKNGPTPGLRARKWDAATPRSTEMGRCAPVQGRASITQAIGPHLRHTPARGSLRSASRERLVIFGLENSTIKRQSRPMPGE